MKFSLSAFVLTLALIAMLAFERVTGGGARAGEGTVPPSLSAEKAVGLPASAELFALVPRQREFAARRLNAKILVLPVRVNGHFDVEHATRITRLLNRARIGRACAIGQRPTIAIVDDQPGDVAALWSIARAVRESVRGHVDGADYVLFADYAFVRGTEERAYLRMVLCDARGEWVIVDRQDSRDAAERDRGARSAADCDAWVVQRLARYLVPPAADEGNAPGTCRVATARVLFHP